VQGLASQLDLQPESAQLWREYRQAWVELRREARLTTALTQPDTDAVDPLERLVLELEQND